MRSLTIRPPALVKVGKNLSTWSGVAARVCFPGDNDAATFGDTPNSRWEMLEDGDEYPADHVRCLCIVTPALIQNAYGRHALDAAVRLLHAEEKRHWQRSHRETQRFLDCIGTLNARIRELEGGE